MGAQVEARRTFGYRVGLGALAGLVVLTGSCARASTATTASELAEHDAAPGDASQPRRPDVADDGTQTQTRNQIGVPAETDKLDASSPAATSEARPEHWPAELPTPRDVALSNSDSQIGADGDIALRHWVVADDSEAALASWLTAIEAAGGELDPACRALGVASCPIRLGARQGRIAVDSRYSDSGYVLVNVQLGPHGHVPSASLPGPCVAPSGSEREVTVRSSGIDQSGEFRQASRLWRIDAYDGPDLDGDGWPERLVPIDSKASCPWAIPYEVYIMRGACGHKVGRIVGFIDEATYVAPFRRGLREIHTRAEWASYAHERPEPVHHTVERTYAFDGRKLVLRSEDERKGVCHHCGVSSCR